MPVITDRRLVTPPERGCVYASDISCWPVYGDYHGQETQQPPLWQVTVVLSVKLIKNNLALGQPLIGKALLSLLYTKSGICQHRKRNNRHSDK